MFSVSVYRGVNIDLLPSTAGLFHSFYCFLFSFPPPFPFSHFPPLFPHSFPFFSFFTFPSQFSLFSPFDEYLSFRIIFRCPVLPSHVFILKSFVCQVNYFYDNLYYMGLIFQKLNGEVYYYYHVTSPEK